MKKTDDPIIIKESFEVSSQELWSAITELDRMKEWFFENIASFEPKVGFETRFVVKNEDRIFPHLWRITEVEPEKRIIYEWKYEGYEGNSFVTFEINQLENGSELILTHQVTETFPQNVEEFKRENCIGGWVWFIKERLRAYLNRFTAS